MVVSTPVGTSPSGLIGGDVRGWGQVPELVGAATAGVEAQTRTATRAILIGVATGVSVWTITRVLDRLFFGGRK